MRSVLGIMIILGLAIACGCGKKEKTVSTEPGPLPGEGFEIGELAPDIVGKDQDGVEFKLSDYRGKVVVIDFWADW